MAFYSIREGNGRGAQCAGEVVHTPPPSKAFSDASSCQEIGFEGSSTRFYVFRAKHQKDVVTQAGPTPSVLTSPPLRSNRFALLADGADDDEGSPQAPETLALGATGAAKRVETGPRGKAEKKSHGSGRSVREGGAGRQENGREAREPKQHARDEHRQHDRRDGTGRGGRRQHRNGTGKFNWGEEAVEPIEPLAEDEEREEGEGEGEGEDGILRESGRKGEWREESEPEPEPPTKSYSEYQAEMAEVKRKNAELFGTAKEREVDSSELSKLTVVKREEGEEEEEGEEGAGRRKASAQRASSRQLLNASFRSGGDSGSRGERGGRGGRGGRGTGRGGEGEKGGRGRGRGEGGPGRRGGRLGGEGRGTRGGRGGRGRGARLDIDDKSMFPTL
ncbi:hypothetical protein NSK_001468 [Nannochloropsis salina CCMP1776]|uniref:Hyaluronan/mRNA-binding protein domain-containing protein n=1 Tax=Nannochloropsis salina CCMP1776 TaxID=1027361 RepID=A0A4D9D7Y9_9STRA|nr:hypothetical protein NSK_001468 [Nannochloropsis salina CCMP1776]|eukprot:TFJ87134.1 hypothetical protein NSK_001468 [Nannochloropsis salina CCMP1776]